MTELRKQRAQKVASLRALFALGLPDKLTALHNVLDQAGQGRAALEHARAELHRLRGTTATYGLADVARALGEAEALLEHDGADLPARLTEARAIVSRYADAASATGTEEPVTRVHRGPRALRRLLVIDDDRDILTIAELSLNTVGGHDVETATSGAEGLRKALAQRPDAVLLDVMMPGLDGLATLERFRAEAELRTVPIVFVTAKAAASEKLRLSRADIAGIVEKPFDPMTLAADVRRLVDAWEPA